MNELLSQPIRTVIECIESWHDENGNWYRIYSDGFCEQGGIVNIPKSTAYQTSTISLIKNFVDTKYHISVVPIAAKSDFPIIVTDKTVGGFSCANLVNSTYANALTFPTWEAKGYVK